MHYFRLKNVYISCACVLYFPVFSTKKINKCCDGRDLNLSGITHLWEWVEEQVGARLK